jgi:hypothetical protein
MNWTWSHLKSLRMSLWLKAYIIVVGAAWILIPALLEQHSKGTDFETAFWAIIQRPVKFGLTPTEWAISLGLALFLGWFTFFSHSKRIKEGDKVAVFLMFCGSAAGLISLAIRHLGHA